MTEEQRRRYLWAGFGRWLLLSYGSGLVYSAAFWQHGQLANGPEAWTWRLLAMLNLLAWSGVLWLVLVPLGHGRRWAWFWLLFPLPLVVLPVALAAPLHLTPAGPVVTLVCGWVTPVVVTIGLILTGRFLFGWGQPSGQDAGAAYQLARQSYESGEQGDWTQALQHARAAVARDPASLEGHRRLAIALHELGETAAARHAYARAVELGPDHAGLHEEWGQLEHDEGNYRRADELYGRAVALSDDDARLYFNRALVLRRLGRDQDALAQAERAVRLAPADAQYQQLLQELSTASEGSRSSSQPS